MEARQIMIETPEILGYEEWDNAGFVIPNELLLNENSSLAEALNAFYKAGGYDFFKVVDPDRYASRWLDFMGGLYAEIEDGKYTSGGERFIFPLSEEQRRSLIEQGAPELFTSDF